MKYNRNYTDEELNEKLAEHIQPADIDFYINDTQIGYDENGDILFYFLKDVIKEDEIPLEAITKASTFIVSLGRGHASGKLDMSQPLWPKGLKNVELKDENYHNKYTLNPVGISTRKYKLNNPVHSNLVGYYEKPLVNYKKTIKTQPKCRLTQFSSRHLEHYKSIIPYIEKVSSQMEEKLPTHYGKQNEFIKKYRERIGGSCYSTITINRNFRTAIHIDKGDFKDGIGTITTAGQFEGGQFCLVDYKIAIDLKPTDILFVNVHKHHANLDFTGDRYSMVSYVRENINKCGIEYDYKVVIPSYGRAEALRNRTLAMLERGGVPKDRIDIWIVAEQAADYLQFELEGYRIMEGVKGVSNQRQCISEYYDENMPLVWCDDDCDGLFKKTKVECVGGSKWKHKELEDYEYYFIEGFRKLWESGYNCYGVYPLRNIDWMKMRFNDKLTYISGAFRLTFNKREYEKTKYTLIEDYARTLNYFKGDGGVIRDESVYVKHNVYTLKGGIQASEDRTEENKRKQIETMISEEPNYTRLVKKKETWDIRFKSVKPFDSKKDTYFMFACDWADEDDIKRMIEITNSVKKQGYNVKIYMYLSCFTLYDDLFDDYVDIVEDAEDVLGIEDYINRNHFIFNGIKAGMIYLKNTMENTGNFRTKRTRNIADKSIIKIQQNHPIINELIKYIEVNKKFDNKTLVKYLEIFDITN
tara:strand:- start:1521 stop:3614 length:2094 start_codon:yes stop_codon:yes gene_type:complete